MPQWHSRPVTASCFHANGGRGYYTYDRDGSIVAAIHPVGDRLEDRLVEQRRRALIDAAPELLDEVERFHEAARCMADPGHTLHAQRHLLPWTAMAAPLGPQIARARGED